MIQLAFGFLDSCSLPINNLKKQSLCSRSRLLFLTVAQPSWVCLSGRTPTPGDARTPFGSLQSNQAGYVPAAAFVNAYLGLGENEEAFAWLEQAYKEQSNILLWLRVHPYFDPLRDDPRFKNLLHRVGVD